MEFLWRRKKPSRITNLIKNAIKCICFPTEKFLFCMLCNLMGKCLMKKALKWESRCLHFLFRVLPGNFPGGRVGKEFACPCRRHKRCRFDPWVRRILWRMKWQLTPLFLPGKPHGQRSLGGYRPQAGKEPDRTELLSTQAWPARAVQVCHGFRVIQKPLDNQNAF